MGVVVISDKKILVVVRWPLGGIRTYMRYMFYLFPTNYKLTLLAASTHENEALIKDAEMYRSELIVVNTESTRTFTLNIFRELRRNRYDLILSQGFISAVAVYLANCLTRIPHILTIHGILEPKYLVGRLSYIKRLILVKILSGISLLYAVSNDILEHLYEQLPELNNKVSRAIVIPNGLDLDEFKKCAVVPIDLRKHLSIDASIFMFGYFGRFMPQKGFDLLIEAIDLLRKLNTGRIFTVVAVGSGDYLREYQATIKKKGLDQYFHFLPFQPQVHHLYTQMDAIVIPSRWEACPLLPMEALCMGTPLIASDCLGLRETVANTPTMVFSSENVNSLVEIMLVCMQNNRTDVFQKFVPNANARYDVSISSQELVSVINNLQEWK